MKLSEINLWTFSYKSLTVGVKLTISQLHSAVFPAENYELLLISVCLSGFFGSFCVDILIEVIVSSEENKTAGHRVPRPSFHSSHQHQQNGAKDTFVSHTVPHRSESVPFVFQPTYNINAGHLFNRIRS